MTETNPTPLADNLALTLAPGYRYQWEEAQNCYVLMYPEGMVSLNDSSGEIMKHIDGEKSQAEIITSLQAQFPDADLADDVKQFLAEAAAHGWIKPLENKS